MDFGSDTLTTVLALVTAFAGAISAAVLTGRTGRQRERAEEAARLSKKEQSDLFASVNRIVASWDDGNAGNTLAALVSRATDPAHSPADLSDRIEAIEQRFPDASTIDKIASVNDAIMATKIEAIERSIERIEGKQLSRWDVVLVVVTVFGAIATGLAIIGGLINLFG